MNITGNFTEDTLKTLWKVNKENTELKQELQRKDNNWNELKEYLEKQMKIWDKGIYLTYKEILDKIKELEEDK